MSKESLIGFIVFGVLAPAASVAQVGLFTGPNAYQNCVAAIDLNPSDAFEKALAWRSQGGGMQADHCAALALIALDEPGEAATRLDMLARRSDAGTLTERAKLLAEVALSAALKLTPRDPELWTDRARARAAQLNWADAEKDLSNALTFDPTKPEMFVLRATARKAQGNNVGYKFDVDAALALDPTYPEALVERGIMKQEAGDIPGARADWIQVLVRAPEGPAADVVRNRIELLEVPEDRK
jgi:regulator of sirC expression with transglutaminase-like and TPR domain